VTVDSERAAPHVDFIDGRFWGDDPHPALAWLRDNDPVHWDGQIWGITKYVDVREISRDPARFSNAQGIRPESGPGAHMIDLDGAEHKQRRKLVNRGFTVRRVLDQEPLAQQICDDLIDAVKDRGGFDFVADFAAWLPLKIIGHSLGFAEVDQADLLKWSDDLMRSQGTTDEATLMRSMEAFTAYCDYMVKVLADRRANPADDLVSVLLEAEVDGERMDDNTVIAESLLILIGGDETTRHVLSGGLWQLLHHRDQWEALLADRSLLDGAVEETLRWVSPIKNMARAATVDVELRGKTIKAGDQLLLLYSSANRDEEQFPDPFRFDIRRSPNDHIAFGNGSHFCLGNALARLELKVAFNTLLDRLPNLRLADDQEPNNRPANFVSGYEQMWVSLDG
jgi:cholest-4-en-3-one 26-monooxygenase